MHMENVKVKEAKAKWQLSRGRFETNLLRIIAKYEYLDSTLGSDPDQPELEVSTDEFLDEEVEEGANQNDQPNTLSPRKEKYFDRFFAAVGADLTRFGANRQLCSLCSVDKQDEDELSHDEEFESENDDGMEENDEEMADLASELTVFETANSQSTVLESALTIDAVKGDLNLKRAFASLSMVPLPPDLRIDPILVNAGLEIKKSPLEEQYQDDIDSVVCADDDICSKLSFTYSCLSKDIYFNGLGRVRLPKFDKGSLDVTLKVPRGILDVVADQVPSEDHFLANFLRYERLCGVKIDETLKMMVRKRVLDIKFDLLLYYVGSQLLLYQKMYAFNNNSADYVDFKISLDAEQQRALVELVS